MLHASLSLLALVFTGLAASADSHGHRRHHDLIAKNQARATTWRFPYGSQKVKGVNLGGWLVLEVSARLVCL